VNLLRAEWTKLLGRPLTRALLITASCWALLIFFIDVARAGSQSFRAGFDWNQQVERELMGILAGARIIVMVLAAAAVASEYTFDTLKALLPRMAGRWRLLASKGAVVLFVVAVLSSAMAAVATAPEWLLGHALGLDRDQPPLLVAAHLGSAAAVVAQVCFYAVVAFCLASLSRSLAVGVVGSVLLQVGADLTAAASPAVAWLAPTMHFENLSATLSGNTARLDLVQTALEAEVPPAVSLLILGAWMAVLLVPTFWTFERRDVAGAPG
jgi:ABC-type transport system involved in multi-copper enzyme maturation permease subunit